MANSVKSNGQQNCSKTNNHVKLSEQCIRYCNIEKPKNIENQTSAINVRINSYDARHVFPGLEQKDINYAKFVSSLNINEKKPMLFSSVGCAKLLQTMKWRKNFGFSYQKSNDMNKKNQIFHDHTKASTKVGVLPVATQSCNNLQQSGKNHWK